MPVVVAATGPLNYLILIGSIDLLHTMFGGVVAPAEVVAELRAPGAPESVRDWAANPPSWFETRTAPMDPELAGMTGLHAGERSAIALARSISADLLLIEDRRSVRIARALGFRVTGTLGLLEQAAERGLIRFSEHSERLRRTSFRSPEGLIDEMDRKLRDG